MDKKTIFQAAAVAALLALVAAVVQLIAGTSMPDGILTQPGSPVPVADFVRGSNEHPEIALGFFGADSLFVLSYLLVFTGLYAVTAEKARAFALVGLGAGVFTALMDATENAFYIVYAQGVQKGVPLTDPALPFIFILTNLKWMGAFAALYAFGVVFPRRSLLEWVIAVIMLAFPLVGVLGVANTSLILVRGLFFLVGMPLFAWYFWGQARAAEA
ncbi:MAG: hypothetical protein H6672_20190 [Anaerolineaceae bacterium]|nr:hypothetical protein [Anaerolineaceae bacterium]